MQFQVLVSHHEKPNKCTILPLEGHPALAVLKLTPGGPVPALTGELFLHPDGVVLGSAEAPRTATLVSAIDSTWKHLGRILERVPKPLPPLVRIPDGFVTAYPRRNKKDLDPEAGLATIEALFIAGALLGSWDETLLAKYHFAGAFLELNRAAFARFGAGCP